MSARLDRLPATRPPLHATPATVRGEAARFFRHGAWLDCGVFAKKFQSLEPLLRGIESSRVDAR